MEYLEEALKIVKAQAGVRQMTPEEMISMTKKICQGLKEAVPEGSQAQGEEEECALSPDKAIRERSVQCLECGKKFKVLTRKHLSQHGLSPKEYKAKWGYKKGTSLIAKGLARDRRKKMGELKLWEKRGSRGATSPTA
ncbi:MucR family transcriptional regulator [Desulfocurvibacter africanus]|uniref:ROSMUCR transcriptional regulator n=1 Tax=Desulfocurvibacter africanus subsp. africanus str. Walvis Bay TaxID=690850 RepID=F3YX62_DESAF|nr:MucR family transcriptional regulator [Desulfocurvibacter africanus]EGJ49450.1 ROSMUCR transcriptional regulator [Desulfocurvibacter africanus subsp. africanus str. Walvis Bay]